MEQMEMNEAIQNCIDCHNLCLSTSDKKLGMEIAKILQDCAQICQVAADLMVRNSQFHAKTCQACADICEACAILCKKTNDETLDEIAVMCVKCADSCRMIAREGAETFSGQAGTKSRALG